MTLVDTNLLVYARFTDAPEHDRARAWLGALFDDGDGTVAFCWPVVYSLIRLTSNTRAFGRNALTVRDAWADIAAYLAQPAARIVSPGPGHAAIAAELAATPGVRSDDVPDIEIAALAIEHGLVLATHDSGFRRFSGLRVVDPLAGGDG